LKRTGWLTRRRLIILAATATVVLGLTPLLLTSARGQEKLSPMETIIRGQSEWLIESQASLRVIVRDHRSGAPLRSKVAIGLSQENTRLRVELFSGTTDRNGTLDAKFTVPAMRPGPYILVVTAVSAVDNQTINRPLQLVDAGQVLLTTDKPLYQPGQTIHLRSLSLRRPKMTPLAGQKAILEVEDPKGNKVFKKSITTSKFGVAAADFVLADEINLGQYTVRAILPQGKAERVVTVERYVLPKFKVTLTADRKYYLPGATVTGKVSAQYLFGKPVAGGQVTIACSTFDVEARRFAELKGTTDADGMYRFEVALPDYFVGLPIEQGQSLVQFEVEVTDRAAHVEKASASVPVAKDPINIVVVPEAGKLMPGLQNTVYILTAYPDGTPAICDVGVNRPRGDGPPYPLHTDALGIAEYRFTPRAGAPTELTVSARDGEGQTATKVVNLESTAGAGAVLLRTDRAIAQVGQRLRVTVLSTAARGTIYLDVIKDHQTILTRAIPISSGQAATDLTLTPDLAGTLELHAYRILPNEDIIRDTRIVFVERADDLVLDIRADQSTYTPGGPAKIAFEVRDRQRHPVLAALGIAVVDESVFALQEMQPGLEKIYFQLEQELMKPRYEIHGFTPASVIDGDLPTPTLRQEAARVLFASAPPLTDYTLTANTYTERLAELKTKWQEQVEKSADKIGLALRAYYDKNRRWLTEQQGLTPLVEQGFLKAADLRDPWGRNFRAHWRQGQLQLDTAGPDGKWGTDDDMLNIVPPSLRPRFRGGGGIMAGMDIEEGMPVPMMAPMAGDAVVFKGGERAATAPTGGAAAEAPVRVRRFFPETMYVNPALITDDQGRATLNLTMADSITTWRLTALASSTRGQLGSATSPLRVFMEFFVDIDLPVALTQNDEVSVPVAIYNYLGDPQTVRLAVTKADWFELLDEPEKSVTIAANDVGVAHFRLRVKEIGRRKLMVHAYGTQRSDAIEREIEVLPDGKEVRDSINDRLDGTVRHTMNIPANAVPGASTIFVKIYPGVFSQAVEGLDSLLRMPFGCFEQTSSVTYPNVLVLDYLKQSGKVKPETQMKAEQYVNVGYQRLVSYEVPGGGFSWFGDPPAHQILTAYGLMEFHDMARVHEVDPALIARTQRWLAGRQQPDGTWKPDEGGIAEGIINRQTGALRSTAYIVWALADTEYRGPEVASGLAYVKAHLSDAKDAYTLAIIVNALVSADPQSAATAIERLVAMATVEDKVAYWRSELPTPTFAEKTSADLETTGLAAYGLVRSGRQPALVSKVMTYLIRSKDSYGTWQTTQATVWSLKALLAAMNKATEAINAEVTVTVNGQTAGSFAITPDDFDVMRQLDLREWVKPGDNQIEIKFSGEGSALYQVVSKYYLPWVKTVPGAKDVLSIDVRYDRTELAANDTATCRVRVTNNSDVVANMVMIDLGVPPGFDVEAGDLAELVGSKVIQKYTLTPRQIILYLDELRPGKPLDFSYRLKARFPMRAKTPRSRVYEYYNPEVEAVSLPVDMIVR
jgi:hypothetical protein